MTRNIEQILASQPLREPAAEFDDRIAAMLAADHPAPRRDHIASRWRFFVGSSLAAGLAAMVTVALVLTDLTPPVGTPRSDTVAMHTSKLPDSEPIATEPVQELDEAEPIKIQEVWSEVTEGELVVVDGQPIRAYERQTVEHTRWIDEKNNVQMELTVPSREVLLTAVRLD